MFQESLAAVRYPSVVPSERPRPELRQAQDRTPPGELLAVFWRRRHWIALGMLCGILAAVAFLLVVTPRYTSVAQLLIDPNDLRVVDNAVTTASTLNDANNLAQVESQ